VLGLQVGFRRSEIASLKVGDFHVNRGYDALRVVRTAARKDRSQFIRRLHSALETTWLWPGMQTRQPRSCMIGGYNPEKSASFFANY